MKKEIKMIIIDVDGTLTNGQLNISDNGELFKSFYCRDGLGILRAIDMEIIPVILTSRYSEIVNKRAQELGMKHIYQGLKNRKIDKMLSIMQEFNFKKEQIAYIGDDINDLQSMEQCGLVGCPADSVPEVIEVADYVCKKNGGYGAVREFIDWIIDEYTQSC